MDYSSIKAQNLLYYFSHNYSQKIWISTSDYGGQFTKTQQRKKWGTSLGDQQLKLQDSNEGALGSNLQAMQCGQIFKKEEE